MQGGGRREGGPAEAGLSRTGSKDNKLVGLIGMFVGLQWLD